MDKYDEHIVKLCAALKEESKLKLLYIAEGPKMADMQEAKSA